MMIFSTKNHPASIIGSWPQTADRTSKDPGWLTDEEINESPSQQINGLTN